MKLGKDLWLPVGAGVGLNKGVGAADFRVLAGVLYTPSARDSDDDRVVGSKDKCKGEKEDLDGFEDEDGCPDPDNDKDGILDVNDQCPDNPEDFDGFEDVDGCPELDNDKDGLLDKVDSCPLDPEDKDKFQDEDGCPELDNDNDSILDTDDLIALLREYRERDLCHRPKISFKRKTSNRESATNKGGLLFRLRGIGSQLTVESSKQRRLTWNFF